MGLHLKGENFIRTIRIFSQISDRESFRTISSGRISKVIEQIVEIEIQFLANDFFTFADGMKSFVETR